MYQHKYNKPTHIWSTLSNWEPRGMISYRGDGQWALQTGEPMQHGVGGGEGVLQPREETRAGQPGGSQWAREGRLQVISPPRATQGDPPSSTRVLLEDLEYHHGYKPQPA